MLSLYFISAKQGFWLQEKLNRHRLTLLRVFIVVLNFLYKNVAVILDSGVKHLAFLVVAHYFLAHRSDLGVFNFVFVSNCKVCSLESPLDFEVLVHEFVNFYLVAFLDFLRNLAQRLVDRWLLLAIDQLEVLAWTFFL